MSTIDPISVEKYLRYATYADVDDSGDLDEAEKRAAIRDFIELATTNDNQVIDEADSFDAGKAVAVDRLLRTAVVARQSDPAYARDALDFVIVNSQRAGANETLQADGYYQLAIMALDGGESARAAHFFLRAANIHQAAGETGAPYKTALVQHHRVAADAATKEIAPLAQKMAFGLTVGEQRKLGMLIDQADSHFAAMQELLEDPGVAEEVGLTSDHAAAGRAALGPLRDAVGNAAPAPKSREAEADEKKLLELLGMNGG